MKRKLLIAAGFLLTQLCAAQVLFTENFENYPLGDFITDPTGATPGLGNWYVFLDKNTASEVKIEQEPTKGKVLVVKNAINYTARQKDLETVWNNRTTGNNVLLVEYELYAEDLDNTSMFAAELVNHVLAKIHFGVGYDSTLQVNKSYFKASVGEMLYKEYQNLNFVKKWIAVQVYADYNTNKQYAHIPALGITIQNVFTKAATPLKQIQFNGGGGILSKGVYTNSVAHKLDNIKITALKEVPPHVLSAESFLASHFSMYPNPASNIVTITNSENLLVQQIAVYDTTGKLITTENYNSKTEIQLNIEDLASGTYLLHLKTNEGTAVKKLVKK